MKTLLFVAAIAFSLGCEKTEPVQKNTPVNEPKEGIAPKRGDFKNWPQACKKGQAVFGSELNRELVDATYNRRHDEIRPVTAWEFKWNGVSVPIPETEYQTVLFDHGAKEGQLEVTLEGLEAVVELTFVAHVGVEPSGLHPDGFYENPAALAAWETTFGRFDGVRGIELAYRSKFTDIKCTEQDAVNDLLLFHGFSMLGADSTEVSARIDWKVFEFTHPKYPSGYRRVTHSEKATFNWELVLLPDAVEQSPLRARYGIAPDGPFADIGQFVGVDYDRVEKARPGWLDAMQTTFDQFSPESMAALEEAFDGTGIKTKGTIGELRALANDERKWSDLSKRKEAALKQKPETLRID